ncbi:uncharacterized protein LOC123013372 [Tribolium madens]|uniref:uncharacterized protein LOC123013372 n=1 Tax=Tribolium madens TaxID=41895 RepID=UPI001CF755F0|nr:uncharacterized protein LOC123013372 [Tribolium madens]XP_044267792.1 uncharacterized protein LOC123013372 [Tribolium madens]
MRVNNRRRNKRAKSAREAAWKRKYKMRHLLTNYATGQLEIHEGLTEDIAKIGNIIRSSWCRAWLVEHKKQLELNTTSQVWIQETSPTLSPCSPIPELSFENKPQIGQTYSKKTPYAVIPSRERCDLTAETHIKIEEEDLEEIHEVEIHFDSDEINTISYEENMEQDPLEINCKQEVKIEEVKDTSEDSQASSSENFGKNGNLLSLSKFLKSKPNKKLTIEDLEQFCKEKKCKVIVCKSETTSVNNQLKIQQQLIETMSKKITQITKQVNQLQEQQTTAQGPFRLEINESNKTTSHSTIEKIGACNILFHSPMSNPAVLQPPPRPKLSVTKTGTCVTLKWTMLHCYSLDAPIASYQVFSYLLTNNKTRNRWRKVNEVKAVGLSMGCIFMNIDDELVRYFVVRAVDIYKRRGRFSNEVSINTKKCN